MQYDITTQGDIQSNMPREQMALRMSPRCVHLADGRILCSYLLTSGLGVNDFTPALAESADGGATWRDLGVIWPNDVDRFSTFVSLSKGNAGELCLYGVRWKVDQPGESFWSEATQGLKQNDLVWSRSHDQGRTWSDPQVIPMPIPGSGEAPGPMTVTRTGRRLVCYAPYNTFDANVKVDRGQVVLVYSDDDGRTWQHTAMLRFAEANSGAAEQWVIELADGRLLGTCWHVNSEKGGTDYPNKYAISHDGGTTWTATRSTGVFGHTTALTAVPNGRCLFGYVQRKQTPAAIRLAVIDPSDDDFGIIHDGVVWEAPSPTQSGKSAEHDNWTDFTFGEPSFALLDDRTVLASFWYLKDATSKLGGVYFVKLRIAE